MYCALFYLLLYLFINKFLKSSPRTPDHRGPRGGERSASRMVAVRADTLALVTAAQYPDVSTRYQDHPVLCCQDPDRHRQHREGRVA